jgi:RNA polymerase sigma factor (TIGR02999 family)
MGDVTHILGAIERGDTGAADELLECVYDELRTLAAHKISNEKPGHTLQATALVHEAFLRLIGPEPGNFENRAHFFGAAAEAMRRILVDAARRKGRLRHGGGRERMDLRDSDAILAPEPNELLALDEALARFQEIHPDKAQLVRLRFFTGLSVEQAGELLSISRATAHRHWVYSRAWLFDAIQDNDSAPTI